MNQLEDIEYGFKDKNSNNLMHSKRWENDFPNFLLFIKSCRIIGDQMRSLLRLGRTWTKTL